MKFFIQFNQVIYTNFIISYMSIEKVIFSKLSCDKSSAIVRASAISSITLLLEAPSTHAVLGTMLPSFKFMIHDKSEKVRLAMVNMLLKIKKIPGIKYYHVVPVEHLLARLAVEATGNLNPCGPVPSSLTNLMQNSYFPQGEGISGSEQVRRTLSFLSSYPESACVFYKNLPSHLSINSICKLIAMLFKCLIAAVETETKGSQDISTNGGCGSRKRRSKESNSLNVTKSRIDNQNGKGRPGCTLIASNTTLMVSITETICSLWETVGLL